MACAHPLLIPNKFYHVAGSRHFNEKEIEVPCRYCLNCRVDKRNFYEDMATYQLKRFKGHGTFLTVTYDNYHLPYVVSPEDKKLRATLRYNDFYLYTKSIRRALRSHYPDSDCTSHNFTILVVGEYGEDEKHAMLMQRPHYHALLFGLDYKVCDQLFRDKWQFGKIVAPLPMRSGCTRYVLKYLDKQQHGQQLVEKFDVHGLERPKCKISPNLCQPLIDTFYDDFIEQGGSYPTGKPGQYRPFPSYYKNKYLLSKTEDEKVKEMAYSMHDRGLQHIDTGERIHYGYSLREMNDYKHSQSLLREKSMIKKLRDEYIPYDDSWMYNSVDYSQFDNMIKDALDPIPF